MDGAWIHQLQTFHHSKRRLDVWWETSGCISRTAAVELKVFSCRRVRVGDLLNGPAAILLAREQPGDRPVGVRGQTPQTSALPAHSVLTSVPLLVLQATLTTPVLPPRLLPQVDANTPFHSLLVLGGFLKKWVVTGVFFFLKWNSQDGVWAATRGGGGQATPQLCNVLSSQYRTST